MKNALFALLFGVMLSGCVIAPAPPPYEVAPPLPPVVELGPEPYYYHGGYYYFYDHDRWRYSRARRGPWTDLPRSHYPREMRRRGMDGHGEFRHEHEGR